MASILVHHRKISLNHHLNHHEIPLKHHSTAILPSLCHSITTESNHHCSISIKSQFFHFNRNQITMIPFQQPKFHINHHQITKIPYQSPSNHPNSIYFHLIPRCSYMIPYDSPMNPLTSPWRTPAPRPRPAPRWPRRSSPLPPPAAADPPAYPRVFFVTETRNAKRVGLR